MIQDQITHLQVLILSDDLNALLIGKLEKNLPLTPVEQKHLSDYKEPNYVETSLLPSLAIYKMETINDIEHNEYSKDTTDLIDSRLSDINTDSLDKFISNNQIDLFDNQLTVEVIDEELFQKLNERALRSN